MNGQPAGRERWAVGFLYTKIEGMARDPMVGAGYVETDAETIVLEGRAYPPPWGSAVLVLAVLSVGTAMSLFGALEDILVAVIVPLLYAWIGSRARRLELPYSAIREARYDPDDRTVTVIVVQVGEGGSAPTSIRFRPRKRDEFETISARLRARLMPAASAGGAGGGAEPSGASPGTAEGEGGAPVGASIPAPAGAGTADSRLAGIRGWLILPAIGLVIGPVVQLVGILRLLSLSSDFHRAGADGALLALTLLNGGFLIYTIAVALAFFQRRKRARVAFMGLLLVAVILNFVVMVIEVSAGAQGSAQSQASAFLVSALQALIWIPYFKRSRRVKATFVNEPGTTRDEVTQR